ncbi:MAG: transposase [Armatimonadota bacterium]
MDLPKRKPNRLKNYDYSRNGMYFITICTVGADIIRPHQTTHPNNRNFSLWKPEVDTDFPDDPSQNLSEYGKIVDDAINNIPVHYPTVYIDKYAIMPDHVHLILMILDESDLVVNGEQDGWEISDGDSGRMISAPTAASQFGRAVSDGDNGRMISAPTVSKVVGQMKRHVSKQIGFPMWQKSFYDHIIRNEQEYQLIWEYIQNNPQKLFVHLDIIQP